MLKLVQEIQTYKKIRIILMFLSKSLSIAGKEGNVSFEGKKTHNHTPVITLNYSHLMTIIIMSEKGK